MARIIIFRICHFNNVLSDVHCPVAIELAMANLHVEKISESVGNSVTDTTESTFAC